MRSRVFLCLLATAGILALVSAGPASAAVAVGPHPVFQGTRPEPPGSGGPEVAFQGTRPEPPGSGGPRLVV